MGADDQRDYDGREKRPSIDSSDSDHGLPLQPVISHHAHFDIPPAEAKDRVDNRDRLPVIDIEHAPVDDDPREWSNRKKTVVLYLMSFAVVSSYGAGLCGVWSVMWGEAPRRRTSTESDVWRVASTQCRDAL